MGFIIWYKVQIEESASSAGGLLAAAASLLGLGLPVKASNDVLSGQYIVDADITLNMISGAFASTFDVRLTNLPNNVTELLRSKHDDGMKNDPPRPLLAKVYLGYFDDEPAFRSTQPVMVGAITRLKSEVNEEGVMETTIRGQELTGFKLRMKCSQQPSKDGEQTVEAFINTLLKGTDLGDGADVVLAKDHGLVKPLKDFTLDGGNVLDALRKLMGNVADKRAAPPPIVIRDNQVFVNKAVGGGSSISTLTADDNIVKQDDDHDIQDTQEIRDRCPPQSDGKATATEAPIKQLRSLSMTVLGDPKLCVGEIVTAPYGEDKNKIWRIEHSSHHFSSSSGYTCALALVDAAAGEPANKFRGANGLVQRFQDVAEASQRAPIDVGEVKEYAAGDAGKHLATLNYGQSPPDGVAAASVATPVDDTTQLFNKPICSPFAFHKTGLIVPIYPKMRALLAHNRSVTNDAVVSGFLWSETPRLQPPENQPGDYWLCLPTELTDGLPSGKGVNDLTDKAGQRVIQAKGLRIFVGSDQLKDVGKRPDVPADLDGTIVIEHQKGARITIDKDGAIKIETKNQDISLSNGGVSITLSQNTVKVS